MFQRSELPPECYDQVQLSRYDKGSQMQLSDDKLSVTSTKGYRTVWHK